MNRSVLLRRRRLVICILTALQGLSLQVYAMEFNTDILDAEDRKNIDLSRFSQAGYIMPGTYSLSLKLNESVISQQEIIFEEVPSLNPEAKGEVRACLSREQVALLGLTEEALEKIVFNSQGTCADFSALEGVVLRGDLSESILQVSVPQIWLEYQDASWLPPSRWENGIPGVMLDYSINAGISKHHRNGESQSVSGSGTLGANAGPWRLRGDWQGSHNSNVDNGQQSFDWSRIYAFRALPSLMAKLTLGEDYLISDLFDSWRYTGMSLISDETQLPPKLRGYAPEVSGIARTNAKVTVSQQGRVLYETTVSPGPFRIQELSSSVNGQLDVRVEEQDGSVQTFQVTTATIPYLTRPGQVRYKLAAGRPSDYSHHIEGPVFSTGEFSWGVANSWSLYGGGIFSSDYNSLAVGVGRDLYQFGALSGDITQSFARMPDGEHPQGRSYRLSYSKRFEEINSDITFAGYRFSEREYLSMAEYLDARYRNGVMGHSKELYTVTASKSFSDIRLSTYLSWSHQTYWDRQNSDRYSLSLSRYFDLGDWRNMAATLSASRNDYNGRRDNTAWLSLSIPLGKGTASYNGNWSNQRYSQTASWYQRLENDDSYRLSAGTRSGGDEGATQASGSYIHNGALMDATASFSWAQNSYTAANLSLNGGMTATAKGAALHGGSSRGGTRMLVSTDGVSDVPVGRNGRSNMFGVAVESSLASYYRTTTEIDVNRLPDDVETSGSPVAEAALTEGAIGFRHFDVLKGAKITAVLAQADGSHPPFGASIRDAKERELGMVSDGGLAWISGANPGNKLTVFWGGKAQCQVRLPQSLTGQQLLLPCNDITEN